ncbi:hypothetical protein H8B09_16155 [Paenibacillus sp. PR3]|uniref:Uncharacterized protein n=1 Tax=Paenibacillus terricola TaxID=2763503 RepID=A0ABR8MY90_9BACL|nr:hypothetical protein [Paenibacillus terricola]MBD3920296.1 hypothetical protein [Paenibacillus terricola]
MGRRNQKAAIYRKYHQWAVTGGHVRNKYVDGGSNLGKVNKSFVANAASAGGRSPMFKVASL